MLAYPDGGDAKAKKVHHTVLRIRLLSVMAGMPKQKITLALIFMLPLLIDFAGSWPIGELILRLLLIHCTLELNCGEQANVSKLANWNLDWVLFILPKFWAIIRGSYEHIIAPLLLSGLWFKIRHAGLLIENVEWRVLLNSGASTLCEPRVFSSLAPRYDRYPGVDNRKKHVVHGFTWTYHNFQYCSSLTPGITGPNIGLLFILHASQIQIRNFYKLYIIYYYPAHWFRPILPLHCLYIIVTQHLQLSYSRDYGTKFRNTLHSRGCIWICEAYTMKSRPLHKIGPVNHMNISYLQWVQLSYSRDYGTKFGKALHYTFFRDSDT